MQELLAGLNPQQKKAAEILSGPLLVLAGAGSGKTRVLTYRIANLIVNGTSPNNILAVTFTNKAAKEMEARIEKLLDQVPQTNEAIGFASRTPSVGTFHATCVRILREDIEALKLEINRNFVIFDTSDSQQLLKVIMKERHIDEKEVKLRAVQSHISGAKNQLVTPQNYAQNAEDNRFTQAVKIIFPLYQQRLREHNALDFDDLLQKTVEVFEQAPEVLQKYKNRWNQLLVDEYQDTNFAQYRFIRLLSDEHQNLCVVGDDHQSIYSFRGADYKNILDFENDFPQAQVVKLEQNYRSTGNILKNANLLIKHNETGREKNLWTENEPGEKVEVVELYDEKEEGRHIAQQILNLNEEGGVEFKNMAVLYRMNAQSRALEESFMKNQIPYQIIGGTRFFDRKEIKDVIAYLRLIFNPRDDIAFMRIINVPSRKLGKATIEVLREYAQQYSMSLFEVLSTIDEIGELAASKKTTLKTFFQLINHLRSIAKEKPISILLNEVVEKTKFLEYLNDGTSEGEARMQNVKELFSVATRYDTADEPLAAFLEGVALISDIDNHNSTSDSVTMMTIHASKGLEFPIVFLPGWEEGIFPSSNSQFSRDALEEERRLAYVALTRAEQKCTITHATQRMLFGRTEYANPSKFIEELDDKCTNRLLNTSTQKSYFAPRSTKPKEESVLSYEPKTRTQALFGVSENSTDFQISDRIKHKEFGEGTVIQVSGDVLSVAFGGKGIKKIVASVAPIEKI